MELNDDLSQAIELLRNSDINSEKGLPQPLFLLVSSLVPLPNVDLLIVNSKNQLLLSRRNDDYFQKSWHVPGGCMRYGEEFAACIQGTAKRELGCEVRFDPEPLAVRNVIRGINTAQQHSRERGHNVAILFRCYLPENYQINNHDLNENDNGYLKWFSRLPDDFMKIQEVYTDILSDWKK